MGPGELALVLALVAALSTAVWASRDARRRGMGELGAAVLATAMLLTFPIGPAVYARVRHRRPVR